jgi:hypothetical protein
VVWVFGRPEDGVARGASWGRGDYRLEGLEVHRVRDPAVKVATQEEAALTVLSGQQEVVVS